MYIKELGFEVKATDIGFKDIDTTKGIVVGYFSAFGNKDADGDIIMPGAYLKTIRERGPKSAKPRIKHFLDHSRFNTVAVINELAEDTVGLKYESKAGSHTNGQDWLKMCIDGIVTEHSVGIQTVKNDKKSDGNYLLELQMWEGSSLQAWGSNSETPITGVKELNMKHLSERFELLEKAIRNGTYTDGTFVRLEDELKHIKSLLSKLTDTTEPDRKDDTTQPGAIDSEAIETIKRFTNKLKVV